MTEGSGSRVSGRHGTVPTIRTSSQGGPKASHSGPELIVMAQSEAGLRARHDGVASITGADTAPSRRLPDSEGLQMEPLFGSDEEVVQADVAAATARSEGEPVPISPCSIGCSLLPNGSRSSRPA